MPIQEPYSGFASLKKWQIVVYKDGDAITYGIIVAKIEIYKRIRLYELQYDPDGVIIAKRWKNYFEKEIEEKNITVIDPTSIQDDKFTNVYQSLQELIDMIKEENNVRVEVFGGDMDSDSEEDNYKPFSDEGRELFKSLPKVFKVFIDLLNDHVWVEKTEKKYDTNLTKPVVKMEIEEVEEEYDESKSDMYFLFNFKTLNTGEYAHKHEDDSKDLINGVYDLHFSNGTILKNQIYHLSAIADTIPIGGSINNKTDYDELNKNDENVALVTTKFSMLKHQLPDIVGEDNAWDSASDSDSDEEDAPKLDRQSLNISYEDFIDKLHTSGESFYMPVITVDNKKRQKDSEEKDVYPYVNPYAISADIKDKFREEVAKKYSTHMRAGQVAKDYYWPEYIDAYRKWKKTGDRRDEVEQFRLVFNDDNMNYFNYPYAPTEQLGNIPRQDPKFMESGSKNKYFAFGAKIKLVLITDGRIIY